MYLIADIGGTKTRISVSEDLNSFTEPIINPTPKDYKDGLSFIRENANELVGDKKIEAVAIGITGTLNDEGNELELSPHLPFWTSMPLKHDLEEMFHCDVFLENDTAFVGLGEAVYGAGKNQKIVGYLTISTGIGGVVVIDKKIAEKTSGFEPGHQILIVNEKQTTLEELASGSGIFKKYGKNASDIKDMQTWNDILRYLAIGINNTILHWSPNALIIGGGLVNSNLIDIDKLNTELRKIYRVSSECPTIKQAELGDTGGLYGAMEYLKQTISK